MSDLVGNPEDRFSRVAACLKIIVTLVKCRTPEVFALAGEGEYEIFLRFIWDRRTLNQCCVESIVKSSNPFAKLT